ncbi:uncharacterized protein V6R79_021340 [Siganus canaliculatus]
MPCRITGYSVSCTALRSLRKSATRSVGEEEVVAMVVAVGGVRLLLQSKQARIRLQEKIQREKCQRQDRALSRQSRSLVSGNDLTQQTESSGGEEQSRGEERRSDIASTWQHSRLARLHLPPSPNSHGLVLWDCSPVHKYMHKIRR